ncbi:MAG: SurA N-terminal domain-containing protein, partial [Usitatibacteraceae bacterium]
MRHGVVAHSLFALLLLAGPVPVFAADVERGAAIARVGDTTISRDEFDQALGLAARRKFYHGKTPDVEMAQLQREVARSMVDNVLLVKEAKRRSLKADAASINKTLDEYEARYRTSEQWRTRRTALLPKLRTQLETESLLAQLRTAVQDVPQPDAAQLQTYYTANLDKFTEPERSRVSTILLKVDPSAPRPVWDKARADAATLVKKLRAG